MILLSFLSTISLSFFTRFIVKREPKFSPADTCGSEQIVSSTSYECPGGPEKLLVLSGTWCGTFLATNLLSKEVDRWSGKSGEPANYWLTENGKTGREQGFIMYLGCSKTVRGVSIRNTHNARHHDRSTKKFRILGSDTKYGPWQELLVANVADSRRQNPPPLQQLMFANSAVVSFIKFELLDYWGPKDQKYKGGGLQYFGVI